MDSDEYDPDDIEFTFGFDPDAKGIFPEDHVWDEFPEAYELKMKYDKAIRDLELLKNLVCEAFNEGFHQGHSTARSVGYKTITEAWDKSSIKEELNNII